MESLPFRDQLVNLTKRKTMPRINLNKISQALICGTLATTGSLLLAIPVFAQTMTVKVTAYSVEQFPNETASGPTTRSLKAKGGKYVASNDYRFGTHLCTTSGEYLGIVVDRMAEHGRVDELVSTTNEAYRIGVRTETVRPCR